MRRVVASEFAALPPVGARVVMTIDARWPDEPGPWTVVRVSNRESPQIVRELAREADYTILIAPETMHVLAELTRGLELAGANSLGSTVEAVETTGNKLALATLLESQGIDIPRSRKIVPADGLPRDLAYPAVLKPVDGAGSIDTYYLCDSASLPEEARQMPLAMLQPFVPGVPMSASFLADGTGQAWLVGVGRQKISIRESRIQYDGGILPWPCDEAVPLLRTAVESIPGLRGFVGIDFLWDPTDHKTTVLEINPRPTTSCVGLCRLLPPGLLAQSWLAACGAKAHSRASLVKLAELVHRQPPITFDAEGNTRSLEIEGVIQ